MGYQEFELDIKMGHESVHFGPGEKNKMNPAYGGSPRATRLHSAWRKITWCPSFNVFAHIL